LTNVIGKLPLVGSNGSGAEMLKPLAIAVIGGLLSSIVLSLVFTPTINFYLDRFRFTRAKEAVES
jgi:Cu/Ag efflux pump CusA